MAPTVHIAFGMQHRAIWIACAIIATTSTACGTGGEAVAVADFITQWNESSCREQVRCGVYETQDACVAAATSATAQHNLQLVDDVARGVIVYDDVAAGDCINAIEYQSCEQAKLALPDECASAVAGTIADGGGCLEYNECASGYCSVNFELNSCAAGTCVPAAPIVSLGGACASGTDRCTDGAFCNSSGVCVQLLAAGGACDSTDDCAAGLSCANSLCTPRAELGKPCVTDDDCASLGTYCQGAPGATVCSAPAGRGQSCVYADCISELYCNPTTQLCGDFVAIGQPCLPGGEINCVAGATCDSSTALCVAKSANGVSCSQGFTCASNFCTATSTTAGVCAAPRSCMTPT